MTPPNTPLGLPVGSVRAILAVMLVTGFMAGRVPEAVVLLVIGFYFGSRGGRT